MKLVCAYLETCRGCPLGHLDFEIQKSQKQTRLTESLRERLPAAVLKATIYNYAFPAFDNYRYRCDFTYSESKLGWYDKNKVFLPIENCPLHINELTQFIKQIAKISFPIRKGSFRFRIGIDSIRGLWLDLANLDIKALLDNHELLNSLFDLDVVVEIGQKGKRLVRQSNGFKLIAAVPERWFSTVYKDKKVSLFGLISSFTQTNPELNLQMIQIIKDYLGADSFEHIVEFGSGVGNFTLFLSERTPQMTVLENDFRNLIPLRRNLEDHGLAGKIKIVENINQFQPPPSIKSLYFVNPSRSGVGCLFDTELPVNDVLYVSCHLESFLNDVKKLAAQGFILNKITLFDQFPHSEHFEIISYFRRN